MNWYYSIEGHSHGPVSESRLAELARANEVSTDTLIWHPGLEEWEPVWKLKPEIVAQLNKKVMAQQAKGTTDRIPPTAGAGGGGASESIFKKLLGRLRRK